MNYLAHAYLSFRNPGWITGNLISDFVKGRKRFDYPDDIQQGILLHRAIDEFTDEHPVVKEAKEIFRADYRLYAGAFVDVSFDHFLATDSLRFTSTDELELFARYVYTSVHTYYNVLPLTLHPMFNRMREQNWLYNYYHHWGMQKSFEGVVWRSKYLNDSETAFRLFEENHDKLQQYYQEFFPQLQQFATTFASQLSLAAKS